MYPPEALKLYREGSYQLERRVSIICACASALRWDAAGVRPRVLMSFCSYLQKRFSATLARSGSVLVI